MGRVMSTQTHDSESKWHYPGIEPVTTAREVLDVIESLECASGRSILLREFPLAPEGRGHAKFRIDGFLVRTQAGRRDEFTSYEVKVSRKDFFHELADPQKRQRAMALSHAFYFAVPFGLIDRHEVPAECGLLWLSKNGGMVVRKGTKYREPEPPCAVMIRDLVRCAHRKGLHDASASHRLDGWDHIDALADLVSHLTEIYDRDDPTVEYITSTLGDIERALYRQGRPEESRQVRAYRQNALENAGILLEEVRQAD
jgi:hypothetical protein